MMTKKLKAPIVGELVEAVPENEDALGFSDIPFLRKDKRSGVRPYQHKPEHDPVLEIAGKTYELVDIDAKEVLKLLPDAFYRGPNDNLLSPRGSTNQNQGRWPDYNTLAVKDIKFKSVNVDGIDIYISNGSELIISEEITTGGFYESGKLDEGTSIIILASRVTSKYLTVLGKNTLVNSTCEMGERTILIDGNLQTSGLFSSHGSVTVDDSQLTHVSVVVNGDTTITDSRITGLRVNGVSSVFLDRVQGGYGFHVSLYSQKSKEFSLQISNQYIHEFNYHGSIHKVENYNSLEDFPRHGTPNSLNIEKRTDFGYFAAIQPISFIRLNQFDILAAGQIFSVKDFFPEFVDSREQETKEGQYAPFGEYRPPMLFPVTAGMYSRNSELWRRASSIAFGRNNKKVIGRTGESIVNSLLDQIKSRLSLYVELNALV